MAFDDVQIRMADTDRLHLDEHLTKARLVELDVLDRQWLVQSMKQRGAGLDCHLSVLFKRAALHANENRLGLCVGINNIGAIFAALAGLLVAAERHGGVAIAISVDPHRPSLK